jgi:hypothetical protein
MRAKIRLPIDIVPTASRQWRIVQAGFVLASAAVIISLPLSWLIRLVVGLLLGGIVILNKRHDWQRLRFDGERWQLFDKADAMPRAAELRGDTILNTCFVLLRFDEVGEGGKRLARTHTCLVWRDSLSADGYRHLLVALRQLAGMVRSKDAVASG